MAGATYDLNRAFGMSPQDSAFGAARAGTTAAAFQSIGSNPALSGTSGFVVAGLVGGVFAEVQRGSFATGFLSAGLNGAACAKFGY